MAMSAVEMHTSRQGDVIDVRAKATIHATIEVVWATLTDYEHLPEFIPGLKKSRVIARKGSTTTVEQSGEAKFLFLKVPIEVTVESTENPPYIEVRRIAGTLRQLQGRYETQAMPETGYVQLRWVGLIEPENGLPPLVGEAIMRQTILSQFTGMVREIERREARRKRAAPPAISAASVPTATPGFAALPSTTAAPSPAPLSNPASPSLPASSTSVAPVVPLSPTVPLPASQ